MNSINDLYVRRQGPSPTACPPPAERCSTCGRLECLCRPRFFAGQILQADDLNRLDAYIRGKNRLHNRQLHGWGVVNGLEVTCNPCGDGVAVGCGYALSPCGDDIVVCDAVSVDVCSLIRRCKDAERQWQACTPFQHPTPQECDAGEEEWILAICYAEAPAHGVKPLRPAPDCSGNGQCSCCGGCASQCGCGGGTSRGSAKPRAAPVQCEPTVVCEGFAFEVYRKPPDPVRSKERDSALSPDSELYQRFQCCSTLLVKDMPVLPGQGAPQSDWFAWMNAARAQLRRYLQTHGGYNCPLLERLNTIPIPGNPDDQNVLAAVMMLIAVWFDAILSCFCSALLPPCPAPTNAVCVPLASVHIAGYPCRVQRICNWSVHRKVAVTVPALGYWLSLLPIEAALRQLLDKFCCFDVGAILLPEGQHESAAAPVAPDPAANPLRAAAAATGGNRGAQAIYQQLNEMLRLSTDQPQRIRDATEMAINAYRHIGKPLEFSALAEGLLSPAHGQGRDAGLLASEAGNLPQFLLLNQLMRPLAAAALARDKPASAARQPPAGNQSAQAPADDLTAIRVELASLRESIKAQAAEIERLKNRSAAPPAAGPEGKWP